MIKKISAIVLALVLCLSVVVMPVSAYELASDSEIAYIIELDKDNYAAGEMVTVNLFLYGKEGLEFGTGAILVAMNSDVFDMSENVVDDIKDTSTSGDAMASWYKDFTSASIAWLTQATVINNVTGSNTEAENAMFNQYLKIGLAKNTSGSHANIGSNKNGIPAEDINADTDAGIPFVSFKLKLKDDLADDTAINIGITTGSTTKNQTYVNYYKNPGNATTVVKTSTATSEIVYSTTVTIGAATVPSILKALKGQMRYANTEKTAFDVRALAYISGADFTATFTDIPTAKSMITEAGFVFAAGNNIEAPDMSVVEDIVKNCADKEGKDGFVKKQVSNISTSISDGNYVLSCMVPGVTEAADYNNSLIAVAYIVYEDANGESQYIYYDAAQVIEFAPLFDAKV